MKSIASFLFLLLLNGITSAQDASVPLDPRLQRLDRNSDGQISRDEIPAALLPYLTRHKVDANGDGIITAEESKLLNRSGRNNGSQPGNKEAGDIKPNPAAVRPHGDEATSAGLDPKVLAELDATFQGHVDAKQISGVIGLVYRNGHRGYFEAFGCQDVEAERKMPKDAIFRLQSMSKPVVTVAALALFEAGKFKLDEPIANYLPEWKEPQVLENGKLVRARTLITPRMLMSHSSGLYYGSLPGYPTPRGTDRNLEAHSKALAARPLKFHPGENFSYGTSIDVLGRFCEVVADQPLDVIVKEFVLKPLKMTDTDFWVPPAKADRIAQIYRQPEPGMLQRGREASRLTTRPTMFLAGQGLCSTTTDYERFCKMLLGGGQLDGVRILSTKTVDRMFENQLQKIGKKYGLGGAASGDGGYGWGGANGTQFWIDRKQNMFGIFMIQAERYRPPTYNTFRSLVNRALITGNPSGDDVSTPDSPVGKAVDPTCTWERSLQLPHVDVNGKTLTGTEVMELAAHNGALYAGNSHWNSSSEYKPTQVFVLKGPDQSWELDVELPPEITRTTYLNSVTFETDSEGNSIEPKSVLILGVNRQRVRGGKTPAVVFVRDDATGTWRENTIGLSETDKWAVGVRSIGFHRDQVTGVDTVFLGVGPGAGIYAGTWDSTSNLIRWSKSPEFKPIQSQRVMDFIVCDGTLYAATQKVLYRRIKDGDQPQWETVLEKRRSGEFITQYGDGLHPGWAKYDHFRAFGISQDKKGKECLLFGSMNRIFRFDPETDWIEPEADIRKLFRDQLGLKIHYAQTQHYDELTLPTRGRVALIGLEVMFEDEFVEKHPETPTSYVRDRHANKKVHWAKQGFYLERHQNISGVATYIVREIHNPKQHPQPEWLARVRSIYSSPFASERNHVIYASGFSPWGLDLRVSDTGWVYRGQFHRSR